MTPSAELARLEKLIPPEKLAAILRRIADRGEELQESGDGAVVKIALHFNRGAYSRASWDGDERIG